MKGVTKAARRANGLSRKCDTCPHKQGKHICHPSISRICSDAFIEGFKKGAKAAEKAIKVSDN